MKELTWDDVEKKLTNLGFEVSNWQSNGNQYSCDIQKYSPAGQDCSFTLDMEKDNPSSVEKALDELYENYDPEAETMLWIGPDGHGKNGAPYHLSDVLKDMEAVEKDLEESAEKMSVFVSNFGIEYTKDEIGKLFLENCERIGGGTVVNEEHAIELAKRVTDYIINEIPGQPEQKKEVLGEYLKEIGITDSEPQTYSNAINQAFEKERKERLKKFSNHSLDTTKPTMSSSQWRIHKMMDGLFNDASEEMNPVRYAQFVLDAGPMRAASIVALLSGEQWWREASIHAVESGGEMWMDDFTLVKTMFKNGLYENAVDLFQQSLTQKENKALTDLVESSQSECVNSMAQTKIAQKVYGKMSSGIDSADFFADKDLFQNEENMREMLKNNSDLLVRYNRFVNKRDEFLFEKYGNNATEKFGKCIYQYLKDLNLLDDDKRKQLVQKQLNWEKNLNKKRDDDYRSR